MFRNISQVIIIGKEKILGKAVELFKETAAREVSDSQLDIR